MKSVIDFWNLKVIEVPDDYKLCTVCGHYKHKHSYGKINEEKKFIPTRTNCEDCYNLSTEKFNKVKENKKEYFKSKPVKDFIKKIERKQTLLEESISVEEMIKELKKLPKGSRLVMTQDGYYAEGDLAYIHKPEKFTEVDGTTIFNIGNSSQNY